MLHSDAFWAFPYDSTRVFATKGSSFDTMEERVDQWHKFVQFETLLNYINLTADLPSKQAYLARFDSLKQSIRSTWDCRIKPNERSDIKKDLYRAFLMGYDPYTEYFDKEEIELFLASLSSELKGVGFFVMKDFKGEYVITDVIKGSSADQNGIKKDDRLLGMSRGETEYSLVCYADHEINQVLMAEDRKPLSVVIRSTEGLDTLSLTSGRLESSAKAVQSFVLKGERTIGYISIPTFYYVNESGGGSMAQDMAFEIYKLKKYQIDGLILGLQGNGGGSIDEAIELISLFIDDGDLFQVRERSGEPQKVKDPIRGMAYYGPLMVLVDGMSASASELVAMVLMEQSRALIVGDQTFGKATAQQMIPLGGNMSAEPDELMKYTTASWYNLRGRSLNETGIAPDIHIPSVTHQRERGESYPGIPNKWKARARYFSLPIEELQQATNARFTQDTVLIKRKHAMKHMTKLLDFGSGMEVSYERVADLYRTIRELDTEIPKQSFEIEVVNPSDEDEEIVKWIRKDLSVLEGYHIFGDWLRLINK
jgi:carboxyl-terminal processing protease